MSTHLGRQDLLGGPVEDVEDVSADETERPGQTVAVLGQEQLRLPELGLEHRTGSKAGDRG